MSDQSYQPIDPIPQEPSFGSPPQTTSVFTLIKRTLFSPSVETFSAMLPEATMKRPILWVLVMAVFAAIFAAILVPLQAKSMQSMYEMLEALDPSYGRALAPSGGAILAQVVCAVPMAFASTLISFFIAAGIFFLVAKIFGGEGSFTEMFFVQSLVTISLGIVYYAIYLMLALVGLLPVIGGAASLFQGLFGLLYTLWFGVVSAMAVAAAARLTLGKGCVVVLLPLLVLFLMACCLVAASMALLVPLFSQMSY